MNVTDPLLDRAGIQDAFQRLGDRLMRRGVVADIYIFGGAAMALAYDTAPGRRGHQLPGQSSSTVQRSGGSGRVRGRLPR